MKIAFHNRQRRSAVDSVALALEFERLVHFVKEELGGAPPEWLKKRQLQQIFLYGQLSVVLVSNKAIRTINKQWRDQDKATDVLSFPLELSPPLWLQPKSTPRAKARTEARTKVKPAQKSAAGASLDFNHDGEDDQWLVGEVIISLERAQEQALEYEHSLDRELAFLFVHGVLHVFGFDHMTRVEEKEMFGRQRRILDAAGIKRK